jgi:hypothetical protein
VVCLQKDVIELCVYIKMSLIVMCLFRIGGSGALLFVNLKFYFYHSYY